MNKPHLSLGRIYTLGTLMLIIQVVLGGITRLTGSGLSITRWDVITGIFPPLTTTAWEAAFIEYQSTLQYQHLNTHFDLGDFQFIYFWEWLHRFWARLIAAVLVGCIGYLYQKKLLTKKILMDFMLLLVVGALQGIVGWIMVKSGLVGDAVYVQPSKLAIHFMLAIGLIAAVWVYALANFTKNNKTVHIPQKQKIYNLTIIIIIITLLQLTFGCFIAGFKAAAVASTWPTLNGEWIPTNLFANRDKPCIENGIFIQFVHRGLAYLLVVLVLLWTWLSRKIIIHVPLIRKTYWLALSLILLQATLGIGSLVFSAQIVPHTWGAFEWLAQFHQILAILFILYFITILVILLKSKQRKSL